METTDQYYNDMLHLIVDLWCRNGLEIEETDLTKHMYVLETKSRGMRKPLAALGVSDLSTISDKTEPSTLYELNPPQNRATSLSAADRKVRLNASMATFSKSVTPIKQATQSSDHTPNLDPSPASPPRTGTYGLTYGYGSSEDSTGSPAPHTHDSTTPAQRPGAPTPSRWNRADPTTPVVGQAAATPTAVRTPGPQGCDLSASLRESGHVPAPATPGSWGSKRSWENKTPQDALSSIDFADTSLPPPEHTEHIEMFSPVKEPNRRRSEPLLQAIFKHRSSRASFSPQKAAANAGAFDLTLSTNQASPARSERSSLGSTTFVGDRTKPLGAFFQRGPPFSPAKDDTPSSPQRYEIDMKVNPDIFGKKTPVSKRTVDHIPEATPAQEAPESPAQSVSSTREMNKSPSRNAWMDATQSPAKTPVVSTAVANLANLAHSYCGSEAKVFVTQEDGKLKVRFKLPTKHAHLFPGTQGTEKSIFSNDSDLVASTPRIHFPLPQGSRPENSQQHCRVSPRRPRATLANALQDAEQEQGDTGVDRRDTAAHSQSARSKTPDARSSSSPESQRKRQLGPGTFASNKTQTPKRQRTNTPTQVPAQFSVQRGALTPVFQAIPLEDANDETLIVPDFDATNNTPQLDSSTRSYEERDNTAFGSSSLVTPTAQLQREAMEAPGSAIPSELGLTPSFATPSDGNFSFTPSFVSASAGDGRSLPQADEDVTSRIPRALSFEASFATPTMGNKEDTAAVVSPQDGQSEDAVAAIYDNDTPVQAKDEPQVTEARTSPPVKSSFTSINKPATQQHEGDTPTGADSAKSNSSVTKGSASKTARGKSGAKVTSDTSFIDRHQEDRDFAESFIRKSRSKQPRSSTTAAGSPNAQPKMRQPLAAKSANESPSPRKRKTEDEHQEDRSPQKKKSKTQSAVKSAATSPKRPTRAGTKTASRAKKEVSGVDSSKIDNRARSDAPAPSRSTRSQTGKNDDILKAQSDQNNSQQTSQQLTGRQAGHQQTNQQTERDEPKSSIPTSVKYNSRSGAGRTNASTRLPSIGRNEQADRTRLTGHNTRLNKFKADPVEQTLARVAAELSAESEKGEAETSSKPTKIGKAVAWDTPLTRYQETPKKAKATKAKAGVTKKKAAPRKPTTTSPAPATPKARLGMVANGTPAKPATRARTRSQV